MSTSAADQVLRFKGFAIALGAATGGVVVGAVLGLTGVLDLVGEPAEVAATAEAPVFVCPDDTAAGAMIRGDRVFATGRDQSGEWIEIRGRNDIDSRVWIRAAHLTPDADLAGLPVIPCFEPVVAVVDTTVADTTTTTSTSTTTTTLAATTTTTLPPAPSVGQITEQHDPIWEENLVGLNCNGNASQFTTSQISAPVTAAAGVQSVVMLWSVAGDTGQKTMSLSDGQYRATLGVFDEDVLPQNTSAEITVTVRVTDSLGRMATRNTTVTLMDCTFG